MQKEWHDCVGLHYNYSSWVLTTVCQYAISSYRCLSYFGFNLFCLASHCYWQTSLQCPLINPRLQLLHHHSHVQYGIREYWCIQNWCIQRCGQHSRDNKMLTKKEEGEDKCSCDARDCHESPDWRKTCRSTPSSSLCHMHCHEKYCFIVSIHLEHPRDEIVVRVDIPSCALIEKKKTWYHSNHHTQHYRLLSL